MRERDPANRWLWLVPLTKAELAEERDHERRLYRAHIGPTPPDRYTCDDCSLAPRCTLAFDSYNTNGDCLYEK